MVDDVARAGGGIMHTFAWNVSMDETILRRDAGFTPRTEYEEESARTVEWFRTLQKV